MKKMLVPIFILFGSIFFLTAQVSQRQQVNNFDSEINNNAAAMVKQGRHIFRFDTFGDEAFWGGTLRLHEAIATVSPKQALAVGLKVDSGALPKEVVDALKRGEVNLNDPAVTAQLLQMNAVVGVKGFFSGGTLTSMGIQCAFCHSTVDDSFSAGIGKRLDGWANQDLNVGAIVSLAPNLQPVADLLGTDVATVKKVLGSWGPGKFDAELFLDGKAFRPDGGSAATLIPPAFGLAGVNNHTWTGSWGTVTYWNAFVANLEMHGQGTFFDPRLDNKKRFPVAAKAGSGHVRSNPDLITSKLPALQIYQLSIPAPKPPAGGFDAAAAERGDEIFNNKAQCSTCHVEPLFTEPGWNLHTAAEIGIDTFQADRAPDHRYRTTPLRGLWTHQKRGFYHDGRFRTLPDVINHYDKHFNLGLTDQEKNDLVEYLKSL
jgi:hypothetical protein